MGEFPYKNVSCENCHGHYFDVDIVSTKMMQKPQPGFFDGKPCMIYNLHYLVCSDCNHIREIPFEPPYPYVEFNH